MVMGNFDKVSSPLYRCRSCDITYSLHSPIMDYCSHCLGNQEDALLLHPGMQVFTAECPDDYTCPDNSQ